MITAELNESAKEKIAKDYVRRLEAENAELLRKVVAANDDVVWESEPIKAKFVSPRKIVPGGCDWLEIEGGLMPMLRIPIFDERRGTALDGQIVRVTVSLEETR